MCCRFSISDLSGDVFSTPFFFFLHPWERGPLRRPFLFFLFFFSFLNKKVINFVIKFLIKKVINFLVNLLINFLINFPMHNVNNKFSPDPGRNRAKSAKNGQNR